MSKRTPGIWVANLSTAFVRNGNGEAVAAVYPATERDSDQRHPEAAANTLLIAAAPELLEALKNLYEAFFSSADSDHGNALMGAEAAIRKAEGK